jgi:hypothetical protein
MSFGEDILLDPTMGSFFGAKPISPTVMGRDCFRFIGRFETS